MKLKDLPVSVTSSAEEDPPITLTVGGDSVSLSIELARALSATLADEAASVREGLDKAARLHFRKAKP